LRYLKFDQEKYLGRFSCVIHWCEAYDKWNLQRVVSSWNIQRFRNYKLLNIENQPDEKFRNLWFPALSNITVWPWQSRNCPLYTGRIIVYSLTWIVQNRVNDSFKIFSLQFKKEPTILSYRENNGGKWEKNRGESIDFTVVYNLDLWTTII
jgi:hypothetical protein